MTDETTDSGSPAAAEPAGAEAPRRDFRLTIATDDVLFMGMKLT